jgi:hypothetical protein
MIFFILALAHAMGIQEMVVRDTEDALEREALEEISSNHLNTKRMDLAHHNATGHYYDKYSHIRTQNVVLHGCTSCVIERNNDVRRVNYICIFAEMVYAMYCGLVITIIHFISTMLLLYGVLTVIRIVDSK